MRRFFATYFPLSLVPVHGDGWYGGGIFHEEIFPTFISEFVAKFG
jgi:hypothetical protein